VFPRPWCLLSALFLFLNFAATAGAQSPPPQAPSPGVVSRSHQTGSKTEAFVLSTKPFEPPGAPMPGKGAAYLDPNFRMTLIRLTDKAMDAYEGPGIQNEYAKTDPENSDGTALILRGNSGVYYLYDRRTGRMTSLANAFNDCGQEPEPRWDASDAQVFYYVCNTQLRKYQVSTSTATTLHDFKKEYPSASYVRTKMEGDASTDRRYWCLLLEDQDWKTLAVIVYDKALDRIVGKKSSGFREKINWVGMSPSGAYCALGWEGEAAPLSTTIYSRDFTRLVDLPDGSAGHGDFALTADGREVYVYQNVRTDHIAMADLATGLETPLLPIPFNVNPDIGLHVSGNCDLTPGWVLVSTYGSKNPPQGKSHSWMDNQFFMLQLRHNPRVWRIAHTQAYISLHSSEEKNYFAEAFASINRKGTRVYFGSNWGRFDPEYSEAYQVTLPEKWREHLPD
jgi:hypothetical protein